MSRGSELVKVRSGYRTMADMLAGSTGWRRTAYIRSSVVRLHGRVPLPHRLTVGRLTLNQSIQVRIL